MRQWNYEGRHFAKVGREDGRLMELLDGVCTSGVEVPRFLTAVLAS
jgi:hypothetical protein